MNRWFGIDKQVWRGPQGLFKRAVFISLWLCSVSLAVPMAWAEQVSLNSVTFAALSGERVQIILSLSDSAPEPLSFTIDNPARIALDLPGVQNRVTKKTQTIGIGAARSVTSVEAAGRTRVVINLVQLVPYELKREGNDLYVVLEPTGGTTTAEERPRPSAMAPTGAGLPLANAIENVDFRRGQLGEGRIIVTMSNPMGGVDMREEGGDIIVEFMDAQLPERLERRLDVLDFATPVKSVDTFMQGDAVRMVIKAGGDYDHLAYQSDNRFTIEVKPLTKEEVERRRKEQFTGERLSLNFQDIEVRAVLQLLADFTGLNLVTSDAVTGSLTLRLKNVPWDQALDIILKTRGLAMRQTGNVILVAPSDEIAAREKLELETQRQVEELSPLRSEFIQINYARASDLASLLKAPENSLLSSRGNVTIDERTNTLLVQDTAEKLAEIRRLVTRLDVPVRQVLIESRIVIASDSFAKDLGVRFGVTGTDDSSQTFYTTTGSIRGTDDIVRDAQGNLIDTGQPFPVDIPALQDRLNLNLPAVPITGQPATLAFAILGSKYLIDLELSALQAEGRGEIISNPRVVTANQQEAVIEQGEEIPYQEASSSGATSTSFKKAVLSLRVTPQITPDDRIKMSLLVSQDSRGDDTDAGPAINTQRVQTEVLVQNGETVVLGGIYQQTKANDIVRVPFFGELPLFGALFRNTSTVDNKRELLIFVTPKVVKETLALR